MRRLRWTLRAKEDLLRIARFIAADNPAAAVRWIATLRKRARIAAELPRAGRRVPEPRRDDIREVIVRNYRIVYRAAATGILVLVVFEGHRQLPGDFEE